MTGVVRHLAGVAFSGRAPGVVLAQTTIDAALAASIAACRGDLLRVERDAAGVSVAAYYRVVRPGSVELVGDLLDVLEGVALEAGASAWAVQEPVDHGRQALLLGVPGAAGLCLPLEAVDVPAPPASWSGPWRACGSPVEVVELLLELLLSVEQTPGASREEARALESRLRRLFDEGRARAAPGRSAPS